MALDLVIAWLGSMKFNDWLSMLSAVVAAVSFLLSRAAVRRQEVMQIETFRNQRDSSLITWANAAIAGIADVQRHCRDIKNELIAGPDERQRASELRTRLSVLLDSGRLFFPNQPEADADDMRARKPLMSARATKPSTRSIRSTEWSAIWAERQV
jgi:hypothetical protein